MKKKYFYVFAVLAAVLYIALIPLFRTGIFNDDVMYLIVAQELWNAPTVYPDLPLKKDYPMPGLPLLLSPVAKLVQPHWILLEGVSILVTLVTLLLLFRLARRWIPPWPALLATAFYAFNPVVVKYSGILMPGPYLAMFAVGSFHLLAAFLDRPNKKRALALGFVAGWGCLLRPEAFLLAVAIGVGIFFSKKSVRREAWMALLPVAGWMLIYYGWTLVVARPKTDFGSELAALFAHWINHPFKGLKFFFDYPLAFVFESWGFLRFVPFHVAKMVAIVGLVAVVIVMVIGSRDFWRDTSVRRAELLAIWFYCLAHYLTHIFWYIAAPRYMLPILPFLLIFGFRGALKIPAIVNNRRFAVFLVAIGLFAYSYGNVWRLCQRFWAPDPMKTPPWNTLSWITDNVSSEDRYLSNFSPSIVLYTGKPTVRGRPRADDADAFYYALLRSNVDYVIVRDKTFLTLGVDQSDNPNRTWANYQRWMVDYPDRFALAFHEAREKVAVFRVIPSPDFRKAYEQRFISRPRAR